MFTQENIQNGKPLLMPVLLPHKQQDLLARLHMLYTRQPHRQFRRGKLLELLHQLNLVEMAYCLAMINARFLSPDIGKINDLIKFVSS